MLKKLVILVALMLCLVGVVQAQEWQGQTWEYATLSYSVSAGNTSLPGLSFSSTPAPTATPTPTTISVTVTTSNPDADAVLNQEIQALLLPMIEANGSQTADPRNVPIVLDYMGRQGWEVVSTTLAISIGGPSATSYAFVLKRPVA